mmetsp:Transcript_143801/g.460343  ORF Transcript_143801/g.460343 Transcript_143801/m.460343 type:complete len:382 (-) Transcript_143801:1298-2443(-)
MLLTWITLACTGLANAGPVVGPGSLTSYRGGPQRSNFGGFGVVQDPALGFFVAGSSLRGVNGVYGRSMQVPGALARHSFMLAYTHYESGWLLALVQAAEAEGSKWLLIDPEFRDRFVQRGGQILPGAGPKWSQLVQGGDERAVSGGVGEEAPGDEDELPWQIVGIMGEEMLQNLRAHFQFHEANVAEVLQGSGLPAPAPGSFEGSLREGAWLFRVVDPAGVSVHARPNDNATVLSMMVHGEYVRVDVQRGGWLRLTVAKERWGRVPAWVPLLGPSLAGQPRLALVPEEEDAGSAETPDHPDPEADIFDRSAEWQTKASAEVLHVQVPAADGEASVDVLGADKALEAMTPPHDVVLRGALDRYCASAAQLALGANTTTQLEV